MRMLSCLLFGLFSFFCLDAVAQKAATRKAIKAKMTEYKAIGLSVAVVKNGEIVYKHAFGKKDISTREKLHTDDLFRIASISKSFSATSILQLVEGGKLSLDDDFGKLMGFPIRNPKFPDIPITLRMVMSHTSSINDSQGYFTFDVINPEKNPHYDSCYSDYAPGKGYRYCNLNYNMAGAIIEKYGGERFDQYISNHVLRPLQIYGGYCVDSLDASRFTPLYEYDSLKGFTLAENAYNPRREEIRNYKMTYSTPIFSPTGGMKISAPDLAQYMVMHMNYGQGRAVRIISEASSREMQKPLSPDENYGLALWRTASYIPGKQMVGHTGSAYGLYSQMFFQPEEKWGLVLITNGCNPIYKEGYNDLLRSCAKILYKNFIE